MRRRTGARAPAAQYDVSLGRGSGVRKATGTFYTPQPIADYLVRRTLGPLVRDAPPEQILALRIVDPAMGSGAFLVAACRYLARAYETSLVAIGRMPCRATSASTSGRGIRRTIAERCLYGVDRQSDGRAARAAVALAGHARGRSAADVSRSSPSDRRQPARRVAVDAARTPPGAASRRLRRDSATLPLFDVETIEARPARPRCRSVLARVDSERHARSTFGRRNRRSPGSTGAIPGLSRWKRVADLWCASLAVAGRRPRSRRRGVQRAVRRHRVRRRRSAVRHRGSLSRRSRDEIARARRLFHWELEFPEVFFGADGRRLENAGFDAVIGNPPWDMIRADAGSADVARALANRRSRRCSASRTTPASTRRSRAATPTGTSSSPSARWRSRAAEGASAWCCRPAWRPITAARRCAAGCSPTCDVDALVAIDNQRGVFPIHRSVRFLLLTATAGSPTRIVACRLGERDPAALETAGEDAPADVRVVSRAHHTRSDSPPVRRRPGDSGFPDGNRRRHRRTRGRAVSACRRRAGLVRALRPRAERHRRPRAFRRARRGPAGRRGQAHRAVSRRDVARARRHRQGEGAPPARPVAIRAAAARLPRRRRRDQPPDAHRRHPAGRTASRRTPSSACAHRCRSRRSTSSAGCSTASSSTTSFACA